jgi:hypothetical protein
MFFIICNSLSANQLRSNRHIRLTEVEQTLLCLIEMESVENIALGCSGLLRNECPMSVQAQVPAPYCSNTQLDKEYLPCRTKLPTENGGHCAKLKIVIKEPARPAIAHAIISRCVGTAASLQNASTAIATAVAEPRIVVKSKSHAAIVSATTSKCAAMDASLPNANASTAAPSAK